MRKMANVIYVGSELFEDTTCKECLQVQNKKTDR